MSEASNDRICRRCRVEGRVQGVFFRASTRERALTLGLRGYARNLPDGSVEVLVCGPPEGVEALLAWLHQGPPMAAVSRVQCEAVPDRPLAGFSTG